MRVKPERPFILPSRPGFLRAGAAFSSNFSRRGKNESSNSATHYPVVCWLLPCQPEASHCKLRSWCDCRCCAQLPGSTSSKFSELHCRSCSRSAWHVFQDLRDDSHKSGMFPFFYSFRGVVFRLIYVYFLGFLRGRAESQQRRS